MHSFISVLSAIGRNPSSSSLAVYFRFLLLNKPYKIPSWSSRASAQYVVILESVEMILIYHTFQCFTHSCWIFILITGPNQAFDVILYVMLR